MPAIPGVLNAPDTFAPGGAPWSPAVPAVPAFASPAYTGTSVPAGTQLFYSSAVVQAAVVADSGPSLTISAVAGLPQNYPCKLLLEWGTPNQEVAFATSAPSGNGPYTFTGVLRGMDGGGPQITHAPGAQVSHGVSQADFAGSMPVFNICSTQFAGGADPTGAVWSDAALGAVIAALGTGPGNIYIPPGTGYKFRGSYTLSHPGQGIVTGTLANESVVLNYYGNGAFLHIYDINFNTGSIAINTSTGGTCTGFTIDGTGAGPNAVGYFHGDLNQSVMNVTVQNFTGANAIGVWLNAVVGWSNWGNYTFNVNNCQNGIVFDNTSQLNVIGAAIMNFSVYHAPNQNAVVWRNSCYIQSCAMVNIAINSLAGASNTGTAMLMGADGTTSGIRKSIVNVNMECDSGAGNVGPVCISLGSGAVFDACTGSIAIFGNGSASYQASAGLGSYRFSFLGWINCNASGEAVLPNTPEVGFGGKVMGGLLESGTSNTYAGGGVIYNGEGSSFATTLASGANTYAWANLVPNTAQRLVWHVTQPASGAPATLTVTGATVPPAGLVLSAQSGATDVIDLWTINGTTTFAAVRGDRFGSIADAEQFVCLTSNYTLANVTTAVPLFNSTASGAITLLAATTYFFEGEFDITGLSATSHTISFAFGGTVGFTGGKFVLDANTGAPGTPAAWTTVVSTSASTVITAAATTTTVQGRMKGVLRISTTGTLIPQILQNTASAAAVVSLNSWFRVWPVGTNNVSTAGPWT